MKLDSAADNDATSIGTSPTGDVTALRQLASGFAALFLVKRKPGMDFPQFRAHQFDVHAPLALALPGLLDYRLALFPPSEDGDEAFDAIVQLTFASADAYEAAMQSKSGQEALGDLPNMLDMDSVMLFTTGAENTFLASRRRRIETPERAPEQISAIRGEASC